MVGRSSWRAAGAGLSLVAIAAAPATAEAPPAGAVVGPLQIRVGEAKDITHIEFRWRGGVGMTARRQGQVLVLTFSRGASPDLSRLRVDPPKFLRTAEAKSAGGRLELDLTLTDDGDAKPGAADGVSYVNLFKRADPPPAAAPAQGSGPDRPNPAPSSGVVVVQGVKAGPQAVLSFPWQSPLAAAAFRRGQAIWLVFDGKAGLDVAAASRALPQYPMRVVQGADYTALRITASADTPYSVSAQGPVWKLIVGPGIQARSLQVAMAPDAADGPATLASNVAGATRILWLDDPVVGDRLAVVPALAPAKGLMFRREFVELTALPSAQGLAIQPASDNLAVSTDGDVVRISTPGGLKLSPQVRARLAADMELPQPSPLPGLIDFEHWSDTGGGSFLARYDALMGAAAAEANRRALGDKNAGIGARMGLARFLVGSELSFEAIGALDMAGKIQPDLMSNGEFRALRGAAKIMAGRYKEAQTDFASPALAGDPPSALWRGYADAKLGQWTDARQEFQTGMKALKLVAPAWRARFERANAEASLRLNDFATATSQLQDAMSQPEQPLDRLATLLVVARLVEAEGAPMRALPIYEAIARAPSDQLASPALLHATQIRLMAGAISPDRAADTYNELRYRWRGDATELDVTRALGQLYLAQGRYRDALEALRTARNRMSDLPEAMQIQADLAGAFRDLFLNGGADGLEPIQALGLFYDFKELTPIGADGDEMVRKLAQRLVNVDLLDQAGDLLKYQADNRLDGVPRAMVATDLSIIELMARKPEDALNALNASRTTLLPTALQAQRRLIEARAWLQLNQLDHAAEILGNDASAEGVALRAEIAWRRRDWPAAAKVFEASLGDRWKTADGQLSPEDESKLLRAAVAYSLAQDDASLARLRERYTGFMDKARWPDALKVALSGVNVEQITSANFAQAISDDQTFTGWVDKMRQRFRQQPLGAATPPLSLRPLNTAAADATTPAAAAASKPAAKAAKA